MSVSLFRRSFSTVRARADFGWQKLVTPITNPVFINRMKELDSKFSAMRQEMVGVPAAVEPIDWAFFESGISNKQLLVQIKAEYDNMAFAEQAGEDLTAINAALDAAIEKAGKSAEFSRAELPKLQSELSSAQTEKGAVMEWEMEDYFRRYPGLEEQCREEYMNADYIPTEAEEQLMAMDVNELRKQFKSGDDMQLPHDLPTRVGDVVFDEELKKMDALLDKMFTGAKQYEAIKASNKAAQSKMAAEQHH